MPSKSRRPPLALAGDEWAALQEISRSRTQPHRRVERARMLLLYAGGETVATIMRRMNTNRAKVVRCLDKALAVGPLTALDDLPRRGRKRVITAEARAWLAALAKAKPTDHGHPQEAWTMALLATHARAQCAAAGHPSLATVAPGTVSKILSARARAERADAGAK